jgi:peptidylamidoglycolate lyase
MSSRAGLAAAVLLCSCTEEKLAPAPSPGVSDYEVVHGWPSVPEGELLGQCSGVDVAADGSVLVFRRAAKDWNGGPIDPDLIGEPTILRFDAETGELLGELGREQFAMPHGLTVDGQGHVWVTDVALHQVFELDESGAVVRAWGERGTSGDDGAHFNMPTDVAVASDGTFYVSDGYGNGRVLKYSPAGELLATWGRLGSAPGELFVPHGIALDPDGNVHVADRGNARVQSFSPDGELLGVWKSDELGRPWAITFSDDGLAFVVDGGDQPPAGPDRAHVLVVDRDGSVIASFASFGNQDGQLVRPHDIAVAADGSVYVVEVGQGKRAQKFAP